MEKCEQYKRCSGCQLQNMHYDQQLRWKQIKVERLMNQLGKVKPIHGMENPYHYRNKVQAVFRTTVAGRVISGVYQAATNGIVAVEGCMLNQKKADRIIVAVRTVVKRLNLTTFDPKTGKGFLKHVLIRIGHNSGETMVVLVTAYEKFTNSRQFVSELLKLFPKITTIVQNVNENPTKLMLGSKERALYGEGFIYDHLCGCKLKISSGSFYPVNAIQAEYLYNKAIELAQLNGSEIVLDAYCKTGALALIAAKRAKAVVGVEVNGQAIDEAKENAKLNNRKNVYFYKGDAAQFLEQREGETEEKPNVVLMSPPRAGSSRKFLDALIKLAPKKIVYITANPETQQKDTHVLVNHGYKVEEIQPVDMSPHTNHVECVVLLSRC